MFREHLLLARFPKRSFLAYQASLNSNADSEPSYSFIEPMDNFFSARKFFIDKRAPKTLQFAVLNVINACSPNSILSLNEALETLTLAEEIVDAVGSDDKRSWIKIGKNLGTAKNLYGKIPRPDIDTSLQCAVRNRKCAASYISSSVYRH